MKLYRSIGEEELKSLLNGQTIYGRYNCEAEIQNNNNNKNACCFFVDEVRWKDAQHKFMIVVDIPNEQLDFGIGNYYAGKTLKDTKIWSGRDGSFSYKIREAYAHSYSLANVKEIFLFGSFANWYVNDVIAPECKKNGIVLHHIDKLDPFENSEQKFIKTTYKENKCDYVTSAYSKDWLNSVKVDEKQYIAELKKLVNKTNLTITQARQIAAILS